MIPSGGTARFGLSAIAITIAIARPGGQARPTDPSAGRLAILIAEDRRAPAAADLATIRRGLRKKDVDTVRIAVRALGRLERPELIPDIVPLLKSPLPEIRAEAANALGQAAQGLKKQATRAPAVRRTGGRGARSASGADAAASPAIARLSIETVPSVRAVLCQTIGRLPYAAPEQVRRAEAALVEALAQDDSVEGRLGVAQGFEALARLHKRLSPLSAPTLAKLEQLTTPFVDVAHPRVAPDPVRDARVRRVALEGLIAAGAATDAVVTHALVDRDAQVRRLALKAMTGPVKFGDEAYAAAAGHIDDPSPIVRLEALRVRWPSTAAASDPCGWYAKGTSDRDAVVSLVAIDQLHNCRSPEAVALLERIVTDLSTAGSPRGWHRAAHAIVALASAAPENAKTALPQLIGSRIWQLRMYAARAAAILEDEPALERLAGDADDNVCEAAIEGLYRLTKHGADAIYVAALDRHGYQVLRAAARALAAEPPVPRAAGPALDAALRRLNAEGRDNSRDARTAIGAAIEALGGRVPMMKPPAMTPQLTAADLRRLQSARARVTIRDVGTFDLALFTIQAPATVERFARLAEAGYYNGLTFHRVVPNFVIQGGSPGANEYVGDAAYMRDEVGLWPHVRGGVGISTRGRDTGDAQIFIDLVDNPRLDHDYTVFAQVVDGMDVVDAILEGDVIERIELVY